MPDEREQLQEIAVGQEHPAVDPKLFALLHGAVVLGEVGGALERLHVKEHGPEDVEAQTRLICADALSTPGTAVIADVFGEIL